MFMIKLLGKLLALPLIVLFGVGVTICMTIDKISGFIIGIFNLMAGAIVLYALLVTHDYSLVRDGIIIAIIENIFFFMIGIIAGVLDGCRKVLMQFVVSA